MTRVALLWHMHQPFYQDLVTGEHILPWVRLHALKDYWGMAALLREFPDVRVTFNLVPSLVVQVEAFARGEARDRHLELGLKPAEALSEEERAYCIEQFFHAPRATMIDPYPRYAELLARRGSNGDQLSAWAQASQFTVEDLRDLQVWHKLVWLDPFYHDGDARVQQLVQKGRGFTEDDKRTLREVELELLRKVLPEYREASARGQAELSTSPFYHPILPLLCDTDVYLAAHPGSRMPREAFRRPEDAREQLARAVAFHERTFGKRPAGLWPSEGSVSDAMVPLVAENGFEWMATDEEILARTLRRPFTRDERGQVEQPELLYRPYLVGAPGATVACGFRDHILSDLIGFTYAKWSPEAAADDFVGRLAEAGRRYAARTGGGEATIFVILDGENAWEHYPEQGRPFLRALYTRLGRHPELRTVTMSEACDAASERLPTIYPGSWINADFYIWIGHPDDQRAWSQLAEARRALDSASTAAPPEAVARAREEMLIAEGSDWFWWYGDDHSSEHDAEFDALFRRHVRNVYQAMDLPIPEELFVTNITTQAPTAAIEPASGLIAPVIDGEITSYFEWIGAGLAEVGRAGGAMHPGAGQRPALTLVEFGFSLQDLFICVSGDRGMVEVLDPDAALSFKFLKPAGIRVVVRHADEATQVELLTRSRAGQWIAAPEGGGIEAAVGQVLEVRIPFACLHAAAGDQLAFIVALSRGTSEVEHLPQDRAIELQVPDRRFAAANWMV